MTRRAQKLQELLAVKRLRELYSKFPTGDIEEIEEPLDAVVRLPTGGCLGIEVRDFARDESPIGGSALNAYQDLAAKVADAATQAYVATGGPPVLASLFFAKEFRCKSTEIAALAKAIADEVVKVTPNLVWAADIWGWEAGLPVGIEKIVVHRLPATQEPFFTSAHAMFYTEILPSHIDYILERKEGKVASYKQKCSEVWLLIVVDGAKLSGWAEPSLDLADHKYITGFARVLFLYNDFRVIEIKTGD